MKITSEVFQVGGEGLTSQQDAAVFLIHINGQAALIDSGCGFNEEHLLENIKSLGVPLAQIKLLLLTHCHFDHTGGAESMRRKLDCKIIAHELDARFLETGDNEVTAAKWYDASIKPFKVDRKLAGSEEIINVGGSEIQAFHIPGHSPGSVAYLLESDGQKVLFGQDVHGPLHSSLHSDHSDYVNSLKFLISLEADILCEGHFGIIKGKKNIEEFIKSYL
ncbi:MBL fold metallo-hydrolase [bacterium]|nr:MBL fold metallo-hydrolase [bacterium]